MLWINFNKYATISKTSREFRNMIGCIFLFRCISSFLLFYVHFASTEEDCFPFLNLPTEVDIPENTDGGSAVFHLALADPFHAQYSVVFEPDLGAQYFRVDFYGHAVYTLPGVHLDYESRESLSIHFIEIVTHPKDCALTLNITDVNEAPMFLKDIYHFTATEGPAKRPVSYLDAFDPDDNDTLHFEIESLDGQEVAFSIDITSQMLSFAKDYDVDIKRFPELACLYVTVYDEEGLSDTTFVVINITGVNDNVPEFLHPNFTLYLSQSTPPGTIVHRVHALDFDDDVITYDIANVTQNVAKYFRVKSDGGITLERGLETDKSMKLYVIADDGGNIQSTATVTIVVISCESANSTSTLVSQSKEGCKDMSEDTIILCGTIPTLMLICLTGVILSAVFVWKKKKKYEVQIFPDKS